MLSRNTITCSAVVALCLAGAASASAQIRGSELGVIAQTVDGTTITLEYSRPVAKGRELFGGIVPWDEPWTGANWATTLEVSKAVRLNGTEVPAGKYSVWVIPRDAQAWTVFFDKNAKLFHFQKPDPATAAIRVGAKPEAGPHTEMLTWSFPGVTGDGAMLRLQWGTTAVPLQIVVQPTKPVQLAENVRARYIGAYDMTFVEGLGWPTTGRFEVFEKNGMLRARLPFPVHPGDELEFDLVPAGDHRFSPGLYRDNKLFNVEMGASFEFDVEGGRASAVRLRGIEGSVFGEGGPASQ